MVQSLCECKFSVFTFVLVNRSYYIAHLVHALCLVNFAGRIRLSGPLNLKIWCNILSPTCLVKKNLIYYLKELRTNRENQKNPEESMPNFQIDFLQLLEEGQRQMVKDEQDEPGLSQELDDFISSEKSENTVKKTYYERKKLKHFVRSRAMEAFSNLKNVPADALDKLLGNFFKEVRKQNGGEYEPGSLSSFQRSIQHRLKELKLSFNILKDEEFCRAREVLAAKRKKSCETRARKQAKRFP